MTTVTDKLAAALSDLVAATDQYPANYVHAGVFDNARRLLEDYEMTSERKSPNPNHETFFQQGRRSARMGNTRSPGNEYRMPVFGCGKSWQARSFARGFRHECKILGRTVIED